MGNEKFYLGIGLGYVSSVSIVEVETGESIVLSNNTKILPFEHMIKCIQKMKEKFKYFQIDSISYSHYGVLSKEFLSKNTPQEYIGIYTDIISNEKNLNAEDILKLLVFEILKQENVKIETNSIKKVEYYTAYEYSLFFGTIISKQNFITMVIDKYGENFGGRICHYDNDGDKQVLSQIRPVDSFMYLYYFCQDIIGFKNFNQFEMLCEKGKTKKAENFSKKLLNKIIGEKEMTFFVDKKIYNKAGYYVNNETLDKNVSIQQWENLQKQNKEFELTLLLENIVKKMIFDTMVENYSNDMFEDLLFNKFVSKNNGLSPYEICYGIYIIIETSLEKWVKSLNINDNCDLYFPLNLIHFMKKIHKIKQFDLIPSMFEDDKAISIGSSIYSMNENNFSLK